MASRLPATTEPRSPLRALQLASSHPPLVPPAILLAALILVPYVRLEAGTGPPKLTHWLHNQRSTYVRKLAHDHN